MSAARTRQRTQTGSLVEIGPVMWFLLFFLTFPLLNLSTIGLRYTFFLDASRQAAAAASIGKSFLTDNSSTDLSATNLAQSRATVVSSSFKGVKLISVRTNLLITNLATNTVTRQNVPLSAPADTNNYFYQIEVVTTADVDPLLTYTAKYFGTVPALTGPARFVIASQSVCENPEGMNQ
jgi:hypothetical protein